MAFTVSEFKSKTAKAGGTARPALFKMTLEHVSKTSLSFTDNETIIVKATAIPAANIAPLSVNYHGRAYKWQGFRTYDNWTTTIINDESFSMRNKIQQWMREISGKMDGSRTGTFGAPVTSGLQAKWWEGNATIQQLTTDGNVCQTYKFYNLWPTELAEIPVDWSSDAIQEYTCTWAYDYWSHGTNNSTTNVVSNQV